MIVTQCARPRAAIVLCSYLALALLLPSSTAFAGGPRYVAGTTYFNSAVLGTAHPLGRRQVNYYVDQGPLNSHVTNQQATAMVDAAAALWSAVPTAGVTLTDMGPLNEDVSGANIVVSGKLTCNEQIDQLPAQPADVTPSATNYPRGGHLRRRRLGDRCRSSAPAPASPPVCQNNGVLVWIDNVNPDATIAHAIILLNGLCATNANLLEMMSFELERAFGRILGLDYSQVNPGALTNGDAGGTHGWPVMQPLSGVCGPTGGDCIPDPSVLRYDDIAALNRIYPITAANLASFPGKQLTAANTVSIQGTITFHTGYGMQGVNVVARPLDANGNPLYQYTVTFVSGALLQRQSRQSRHRLRPTRTATCSPCGDRTIAPLQGCFRSERHSAAPRRHHGQLPGHLRGHQSALHPRQIPSAPISTARSRPPGTLATITVPGMSRRQHANPHRQRRRLRHRRLSRTPSAPRPRRAPCPPAACGAAVSARWAKPTGSPSRSAATAPSPSSPRHSTRPARPPKPRPCPPSASGTHSIPSAQRRSARLPD